MKKLKFRPLVMLFKKRVVIGNNKDVRPEFLSGLSDVQHVHLLFALAIPCLLSE